MFFTKTCFAFEATNGSVVTVKDFQSNYVASRNVHIWLPEQYQTLTQQGEKFAVLYMHDGQMLFDASKTWNKQEWGVDEVASKLMKAGKVKNFIVVGIDNGGSDLRHAEYFPQKPFESLTKEKQKSLYQTKRGEQHQLFGGNKVQSDHYLKFLVSELKPYIDQNYKVYTDVQNTYVMGSSMGGLISMYAISEYPDVFGVAACLSTHWPGAFEVDEVMIPNAFYQYMKNHLPNPETHRIYFDHGTETLDAWYPKLQKQVDEIMTSKGYSPENWETQAFEGAAHTEDAWKERLHIPLIFMFGK